MREFEIIAHGFGTDSDAQDVEKALNDLVAEMKLETRVAKVYEFSDPTSISVIRFQTIPFKHGFYKKLKNHVAKTVGESELRFENDRTVQEQERDKHLGYTKNLLIQRQNVAAERIKINWRQGNVEVDGVKVAWLSAASNFEVSGVAAQVREEVLETVKEFLAKRSGGRNSSD